MQNIILTLHNTLKPLLESHERIELILAYSGGIDSQVLLHALTHLYQQKLISNQITVCHVNHGLSENAATWQTFAQQQCANLPVKFVVKSVHVKAKAKQSLEALARDARYLALKSVNAHQSIVLTGHHSDDQSETLLLALKRGAGLKGLAAMSAQIKLGQHLLIRPFLSVSRTAIEAYAKFYQLSWVEDDSNLDERFDRNFIRHQLMPLLQSRWPSIKTTINRSADHCTAGQELLDELGSEDLLNCRISVTSLDTDTLKKLSTARFNNVIRFFMATKNCLMPSLKQLNQVRMQLTAKQDKSPEINLGDHMFRRYKQALYLTRLYQDISDWQTNIDLSKQFFDILLPDNIGVLNGQQVEVKGDAIGIRLPNKNQQVSLRFKHDNPMCLPDFRQKSRQLKKVLQELNIPTWQRKRIAFLYYDDELVAAINHFICQPFVAKANVDTNLEGNEQCLIFTLKSEA
jgi:tRNA(Ile)-lysidine synthase